MNNMPFRCYFLVLLLGCFGTACQREDPVGQINDNSSSLSINIPLGKLAVSQIATAEIVISGSGWVGIRQALEVGVNSITGRVSQVLAGNNRKFVLNAYDADGNLAYTGEAYGDVKVNETITVRIVARPVDVGAGEGLSPSISIARRASAERVFASVSTYTTRVTLEIVNEGDGDATGLIIRCRARGSSGGAIGDASVSVGTLAAGNNALKEVVFPQTDGFGGSRFVTTLHCTPSYDGGEGSEISVTVD
jgi:hypothetical protein